MVYIRKKGISINIGIKRRLLNHLYFTRYYFVNTFFVVFQLRQLIIKTYSLGNCCLPYLQISKRTEILGILSRFEFIKSQWTLSIFNISVNFKNTKKADYVFESSWDVFIYQLSIIGNRRQFSSHLLISMFIGTPCPCETNTKL